MKNASSTHIFEYQQMMIDSPLDQALRASFQSHLQECAECRANLSLLTTISEATRKRLIKDAWAKSSDVELVNKIQNRLQQKRRPSGYLQPVKGLAWILMILLMVLLISWSITRLRAGSKLVPSSPTQASVNTLTSTEPSPSLADCPEVTYTVNEGDTILAISVFFMVDPGVIRSINNLEDNAVLQPGMDLVVPYCSHNYSFHQPDLTTAGVASLDNCPYVKYTIQPGDTVKSISKAINVPEWAISYKKGVGDLPVLTPGTDFLVEICK